MLPTEEELADHYRKNYYDGSHTNYPGKYSSKEIEYFHYKDKILDYFLTNHFSTIGSKLLDVGCGEGFTLKYFLQRGWDCFGTDFSFAGVRQQNPEVLSEISFEEANIVKDDYFTGDRFDVIVGNGILEHVTDKDRLLRNFHEKLCDEGCLFILVPNDFSVIQRAYLDKHNVADQDAPWVVPLEHLTYFSADSLGKTVTEHGFEVLSIVTDFPIEMFLLNNATNVYNTDFGPTAHQLRVEFCNAVAHNIKDAIKHGEVMAQVGIGRCLMGIFRKL